MTATVEIPEYPLFDVSDVEAAMGADMGRYVFAGLGWDGAKSPSNELSRQLRAEAMAGDGLFFRGGALEAHKPDLDAEKVHRALSALMRSWGVSQQQKSASLALAIHRWCDPIPQAEPSR